MSKYTREDVIESVKLKHDLERLDLSGLDLSNLRLTNTSFIDSDMSKCNLTNSSFAFSVLSPCDLSGAYLYGADIDRARTFATDICSVKLGYHSMFYHEGFVTVDRARWGCYSPSFLVNYEKFFEVFTKNEAKVFKSWLKDVETFGESIENSIFKQYQKECLFEHVRCNRYDSVEMLLKSGCSPNITNKDGSTPLHVACRLGYSNIASTLLNNSANPNLLDNRGMSPIFDAAFCGDANTVRLLIRRGCDLFIEDSMGHTPVERAIRSESLQAAEILAKAMRGCDV